MSEELIARAHREEARAVASLREFVSVSAYATKYGVSIRQVRKWLAAGTLDNYRVGRMIRVRDRRPDQNQPSA